MDIFNLDQSMNEFINETNKDDLKAIVEKFKSWDFQDVLTKTNSFRVSHKVTEKLETSFLLIDATSYAQIGNQEQAANIIKHLYQNATNHSIDDLILYSNLAFMCDHKLSRRIMSDAVNQLEKEPEFDRIKAAHAYLVLGEAEENLQKFIRSIKYYKQSLTYFLESEAQHNQMILFLHFKLGVLHSAQNEIDEAIEHLQKTIDLIDEDNLEIKLNILVSIAKLYGSKDNFEKAVTYLEEAIPMLENSSLANSPVHAEAYSEMAYSYFYRGQFDEAIPYYEKAVATYTNLPNFSVGDLGVIYMQYAYCVQHQTNPNITLAGELYDNAYIQLEQTNNPQLIENALTDIIVFFENTRNKQKKKFYEGKFDELTNEKELQMD